MPACCRPATRRSPSSTYTGTSGLLPEYIPSTGAISNVTLSSGAVAPVAGVFSSDNLTFFAGTSGDNQVHLITGQRHNGKPPTPA